MRRSKLIILILSVLLCVLLFSAALADGAWGNLWTSGCNLLFRTDNVTVDGEAVFSLEGERFKTASLHYVQDGYSSLYDLKLLTPKADGTERETGWTIIADDEGLYNVMEVYYPGTYLSGSTLKQNSLLRRTVELDALVDLGGIVVNQMEPLLPEGTIVFAESEGGKTAHIVLNADQMPELAASALNLAASYMVERWFFPGYDRDMAGHDNLTFDSYVTPTEALTYGTVRWALQKADVECALDGQERLTAVRGEICMASTFMDGTVREVTVQFELNMTDYGTSHVEKFDPDKYNVTPRWDYYYRELDEAEVAEWSKRAAAVFEKQGYAIDEKAEYVVQADEDSVFILITNPDGKEQYCAFNENGGLIVLERMNQPWSVAPTQDGDGVDADTIAKAKEYIRSFLADENPAICENLGDMTLLYKISMEDGSLYLAFHDADHSDALFVIRVAPAMRIECFYE